MPPEDATDLEQHEYFAAYKKRVQEAVDQVVEMAEAAENANRHALSGWYGSVCAWIREREKTGKGFTLTLPDPDEGGDPITIIEV